MLTATLTKFTAGAKLCTFLNSVWVVVVRLYEMFFAAPAVGGVVN